MTPVEAIMKKIRTAFRGPVPVRVDKSFITPGEKGGYRFNGTVLRPGTLEETGEVLQGIEIPPVWAGTKGQGIFCPPEKGQVVIVGFLDFNSGFPYYQGIYSKDYIPSAGKEGAFLISDGKGGLFRMSGAGLLSLANSSTSLKAVLDRILSEMKSLTVTDPVSGALPITPDNLVTIEAAQALVASLLEE